MERLKQADLFAPGAQDGALYILMQPDVVDFSVPGLGFVDRYRQRRFRRDEIIADAEPSVQPDH